MALQELMGFGDRSNRKKAALSLKLMQICSHSLWNKQHSLISAISGCTVCMSFKISFLSFWITRKFLLVQPTSCHTWSSPPPRGYISSKIFMEKIKACDYFSWKTEKHFPWYWFLSELFHGKSGFRSGTCLRFTDAYRYLENVCFFIQVILCLDN